MIRLYFKLARYRQRIVAVIEIAGVMRIIRAVRIIGIGLLLLRLLRFIRIFRAIRIVPPLSSVHGDQTSCNNRVNKHYSVRLKRIKGTVHDKHIRWCGTRPA